MPIHMQEKRVIPSDVHQVHSVLRKFGRSFLGAQQLLRGEIVTNPEDRQAIGSLISDQRILPIRRGPLPPAWPRAKGVASPGIRTASPIPLTRSPLA
jgi:hypothetical protein